MRKFEIRGELFYDTDEEEDVYLRSALDDLVEKGIVLTIEAPTRAEAERIFFDRLRKLNPSATGFIALPAEERT